MKQEPLYSRKTPTKLQQKNQAGKNDDRGNSQTKTVLAKVAASKNIKNLALVKMYTYLMSVLPEPSRHSVRRAYEQKYKQNPNEVYHDHTEKKYKLGLGLEKFYRKNKESIPEVGAKDFGNARPQKTVFKRLEDEELGSLLLFKVPRHCRNHSVGEEKEQTNFFNLTAQSDSNRNILQEASFRVSQDSHSPIPR